MSRPTAPRRVTLWPIFVLFLLLITALSNAGPLTLARKGTEDYVIVIPAAATSQDQKAAADLALWLGQMTGAKFEIVPDTQTPRRNPPRLSYHCL